MQYIEALSKISWLGFETLHEPCILNLSEPFVLSLFEKKKDKLRIVYKCLKYVKYINAY